MQLNETEKMVDKFCDMLQKKFENRINNVVILNIFDDPYYKEFSLKFEAYDYFPVRLNYDKGRFGCCICFGDGYAVDLDNSQEWWDTADFDVFFDDLERELELRIPDKFLKAKGWYKKPKGWFKD